MSEFDSKTVRVQLNPSSDMDKLRKIIEKKGGKFWNKKGNRAYFSDDANDSASKTVYAMPYSAYVDLDTKEIVFEVNADDYAKQKNTDEDYKTAYINSLRG